MSFADSIVEAYRHPGQGPAAGAGTSVRIDDRQERDVYPGFCEIHVTAQAADGSSVLLELSPAPYNPEVCGFVEGLGGQVTQGSFGATIRLRLSHGDARPIRDLARVIRRVTGRGQRYPDPNWKWICPRTAASLERLAGVLSRLRRSPGKQAAPVISPAANHGS